MASPRPPPVFPVATGALLAALAVAVSACGEHRTPAAVAVPAVADAAAAPAGERPAEEHRFGRDELGVERPLGPGDLHLYRLGLEADRFLRVAVEQRGIDVHVQLLGPSGAVLIDVDSPTGRQGAEHLAHVTSEAGDYVLAVRAFGGDRAPGAYLATIAAERPAGPDDRAHAAAETSFADARVRASEARAGTVAPAAVEGFEAAAAAWRRLGKARREADALLALGNLHRDAGRSRDAAGYYRRAIPLLATADDRRDLAIALNELALAVHDLGDAAGARESLGRALELFRRLGDRRNEASVLHNLGRLDGRQGRPLEALGLLGRAAARWRELGDRGELVKTLNVIGEVYGTLGEAELALDHHHQALELLDPRTEPAERATTMSFIGRALLEAGDLDGAAEAYSETLALRRESGDAVGRARAWVGLGLVEERRGNPERTADLYRRALEVFERQEVLLDRAILTNNLAWLADGLGDAREAEELHRRALALFRRLADREGEATSLLGLARARRRLGRAAEALDTAEDALAAVESVLESGPPATALGDPRVPYRAARERYYDLYIDLLMEQHRRRPDAGFDALALAASEQARARNLLEILGAGAVPPAQRVDPALLGRRDELRAAIDAADRRLRSLRAAGADAGELEQAERRQRLRLAAYHRVAREIRRRSPWRASLEQPRTLALDGIQRLLDDDTVLLEFYLGEQRSFVWLVSRTGLESHELPPRPEIEPLARRTYRLLKESDRVTHEVPAERALAELAGVLLGPVAGRLGGRRLAVVAGGALEYVPFAALPVPAASATVETARPDRRLIEDHEIVHLPSASVLAALRDQTAGRSPPPGLLALIADPVFGPGDPRLAGRAEPTPKGVDGAPAAARLAHSRREAREILALAEGRGPVLSALGFDAHRDLAAAGELSGYRILHFATHGVLHADHPELSALVFSGYHPDGRPRESRLALLEIHGLRLPADLVVLSACRTALGKEVRGEGLLGLPRGFLYAGSRRVVVSLWNVHDESTAELMSRFYRHLLVAGEPPAAALRAAQRSMLAEPRYAPYHWAGFVLQGDWR